MANLAGDKTFSRFTPKDPEANRALQDVYNKLSQVQQQLTVTVIPAQSITIQVGTVLTINAQGQITGVKQP